MSTTLDDLMISGNVEPGAKSVFDDWRDILNFIIEHRINDQISGTISTGAGTIKMSSANPATNTKWIPIYFEGQTLWIPAWSTNVP